MWVTAAHLQHGIELGGRTLLVGQPAGTSGFLCALLLQALHELIALALKRHVLRIGLQVADETTHGVAIWCIVHCARG